MNMFLSVDIHADRLYEYALRNLIVLGNSVSPRGQSTYELIDVTLRLIDAERALVLCPARRLNYHFAMAECWWIATGRDDVDFISRYNKQIAQFSDDGVTFAGAYGPRWRRQVFNAIAKLRVDPNSRQAVVSLWQPDLIVRHTKDVPCTLSLQYLLRDDALHCVATMRSSDAWLGLPYDLHNFARLQAMVAGELGAVVGGLTMHLGSSHYYRRDETRILEVLSWYEAHRDTTLKAMYDARLDVLPRLPEVPDLLTATKMETDVLPLDHPWRHVQDALKSRDSEWSLSDTNAYGRAILAQRGTP